MPDFCQVSFPAILTHRSAIDKDLFYFLRGLMLSGVGPVTLAKLLNEISKRNYHDFELSYYDSCLEIQKKVTNYFETNQAPPQRFCSYDDKDFFFGAFC
jgi:hypothetical protein